MKQGPSIRTIPEHSTRICNGCSFLITTAGMRGHKTVTNTFTCSHHDFKNERELMTGNYGRIIHYNHEGYCDTPSFCPFLNKPKDEK